MKDKKRKNEVKNNFQFKTGISLSLIVLGFVGMGISGYLTYGHLVNVNVVCPFEANCDLVAASPYAKMWGVPISLLGSLMYAALTLMEFWLLRKESKWEHLIAMGAYAVALSGTIFTVYLYYLEIFVIHAFCSWCIASSVVIISILILSLINLFTTEQTVEKKTRRHRFKLSDYIGW